MEGWVESVLISMLNTCTALLYLRTYMTSVTHGFIPSIDAEKIEEYCVQIEWTENLTRAFIHRVTGTIWRRKNIYSGFRYIPLSGRPSACVARMCCVCVWCLRTAYINCGDSLFHNNHQRIYCGKVITQRNRRLIIPNKIWIIFSLVKTSYHLLRIASNWGTFFSYTYLRQ